MKNTNKAITVHPEYNLYQKGNTAYCTSLQVAKELEKRHADVLRDIKRLEHKAKSNEHNLASVKNIADFFNKNFIRTTYTDAKGEIRPMYLITQEGLTVLINNYTGDKALYFSILYAKRFKDMQNFIRDYILAKDEFPIFTQAIADAHEKPQPYHYSNEMNMIYRIVLGMDAKTFREAHGLEHGESIRPFLSEAQQKTIRKLQTEDIRLLYKGAGYNDRKNALTIKALTAKVLPAKI